MEAFVNIINSINNVIWSNALIIVLVVCGIFFTIGTKGIQFRCLKDMWNGLFEKDLASGNISITPYQAFCTTVGCRVGMGNIAGVAAAIYFGGPGSVVWMWITAIIGSATAVVETILGQAYKDKTNGELVGSPAYYMKRGLKSKVLGALFAIATILGPAFLMSSSQTAATCAAINVAFGVPTSVVAVILMALVGLTVIGGIKRIGEVASTISPVMCALYLVIGLIIFFANITKVPAVIGLMFRSAFGADAMFGGIIGSTIAWGVKRGLYSNDAGDGMGPILSSTAETSHPVKQGLVQGFSIYIDTLLVCSITAFSILLSGAYNVEGANGAMLFEGAAGIGHDAGFMQEAASRILGGNWGAMLIAIVLAIFVFSTLICYCYQLESSLKYLLGDANKVAVTIGRILVMLCILWGGFVDNAAIWAMADTGAGAMAWLNLVAILVLSPMAFKIIKDYDKQKKAGLDPIFDPKLVGINDENGVWDEYVEKKKARGDYENPELK